MTNFREWAKAAGIRAVRTFAEAMLAYIGTVSAGAFGAVTALLLALTGLPEVED